MMWFLGLFVGVTLLGAAFLIWMYHNTDIPDPNEFAEAQSSIVYYSDGETELARFTGGYNRESVSLDQVPDHVQHAILAAEDRDFYNNPGVSLTGTLRAMWSNVTSGEIRGGGSTITQQYVKNYFLTHEQSLARKLDEALIAVKIENQLSKEEILESYLNTIYFGRGAYGIQTASQAFFDKDVEALTVAEGAFLATVINAPSYYDPAMAEGNQGSAESRFGYVINGMVSSGWLGQADADEVEFPEIQEPSPVSANTGTEGYIAQEVRTELVEDVGISEADIDRGGLRVVTTIDPQHQAAAEDAVNELMPDTEEFPDAEDLHAGVVAVRPGDGAITALYGGQDYEERSFNNVTDARLQAGSLFKVFTLVGALQNDITTMATYPGDSPMTFTVEGQSEPYEVNNFGLISWPVQDLRAHLAQSTNTSFVMLNEEIGPEATREAAVQLGLPEDTVGLGDDLSNVLGSAAPSPLEMTNAYAAIAAEGELSESYIISEVTSVTGDFDYEASPDVDEAIDGDIAIDVTEAMTHVMTEGTGVNAGEMGRPTAGKSGTSENNVSAWFSGFTPQLAGTAVLYRDDGTVEMHDIAGLEQITGGGIPAQIWGEFMRDALDGEEVLEFPERVGVNDNVVPTQSPTPTMTSEPTTEEPTTDEPTTEDPTTEDPTTEDPTTTEPDPDPTEPDPTPTPTDPEPTPTPTPTDPEPTDPEDPDPDDPEDADEDE